MSKQLPAELEYDEARWNLTNPTGLPECRQCGALLAAKTQADVAQHEAKHS